MTDHMLLEKFTENLNVRKEELLELQRLCALREIENALVQDQLNEICNEVLTGHPFYAERDCIREWNGVFIYKGDRIIAYNYQWLMSAADYKEFQELCRPKKIETGLVDEDGNYTEKGNTEKRLMGVKSRLMRFVISLLPEDFPDRKKLEEAVEHKGCYSYRTRKMLLEIAMRLR